MTDFQPPARFWELLDAALEGQGGAGIGEADIWQELEALLVSNPQLRRLFLDHVQLRIDLREHGRRGRAREKLQAHIARSSQSRTGADAMPYHPAPAGRWRSIVREFAQQPLAVAILLLVMISGGVLVWQLSKLPPPQVVYGKPEQTLGEPGAGHGEPSTKQGEPGASAPGGVQIENEAQTQPIIARLARSIGAIWDQADAPSDGAALHTQQKLRLKQGLVEIRFDSGATVILEGPAEFEVGSRKLGVRVQGLGGRDQGSEDSGDNACSLALGKLVAQVPQQAHGFTVTTPTMTIVDKGTEFGVFVKPEVGGQRSDRLPLAPTSDFRPPTSTEVHVIQGELSITGTELVQAANSPNTNPPASDLRPPTLLKAGQAVSSETGGAAPRVIKAEPSKFVRQLPPPSVAAVVAAKSPLKPGDILAVTRNTLKLVKIDPKTGQQTVLVQGDPSRHGTDWMCVTVNAQGELFVGTDHGPDQGGQVLQINVRDGSIRVLASGGHLANRRVNGITLAADGTLYATLDGVRDEVVRIDPRSGVVSDVVSWGDNPWGISVDINGHDLIAVSDLRGTVAQISGQTVTPWTEDSGAGGARGVAIRPDGRVFVSVTNGLNCKILEVHRGTHRVSEIVSVPRQHEWTFGMLAVEAAGWLIFGNGAAESIVYRVDVDARTITPVASKVHLERVFGIAVVPEELPGKISKGSMDH